MKSGNMEKNVSSYKYKFAVVMSIYNVEPYLHEAVESIIAQSYGFNNIQLIMVDDGSTDKSGAICNEYASRYPDNIKVIHKENGGLSSSRNCGIKACEAEYVNFADPDDYIDKDMLSQVDDFVTNHGEVDVVAVPILLFGNQSGEHTLNYKFRNGSRVIDLTSEWQAVQLSLATAFIKVVIAREIAFHEDLHLACGEDAREIVKLLLNNPKLGVVSGSYYHYRKRDNSMLGNIQEKKNWYSDYLADFPEWVIRYCMDNYGTVPRFVQNMMLYDLQWKFRQTSIPDGVLTDTEASSYKQTLYGLLKYFDDVVIQSQKYIGFHIKSYLYYKKYNAYPKQIQASGDVFHLYGDCANYPIGKYAVYISFVELYDDHIILEGKLPDYIYADEDQPCLFSLSNEIRTYAEYTGYSKPVKVTGDTVCFERGFKLNIPVSKSCSIKLYRDTVYGAVKVSNIHIDKYFPVCYRKSYYKHSKWILMYNGADFTLKDGNADIFKNYEIPFLRQLWATKRKGSRKAVISRLLYRLTKQLVRNKQIWLIADKGNRADDNGEAFFKYLCNADKPGIKPVFLIAKDSNDYKRLRQYGTVVPYMSWRHKFLYLNAKYIISAYSHDELNNPFERFRDYYRDIMYDCDYIFLQHGITKDDISNGTNRYHKNIRGFVTSAYPEWRSIVDRIDLYGYASDNIWQTGMPRYDYLYNDEQKVITIMPTWRRNLFGDYHPEHSQWDLKPGFEESRYFTFYESLLNDKKLWKSADDSGYRIVFVPHPVLFPYIDRFAIDKSHVEIKGTDVVYRDIFAHSSLIVTDFSSVAFDFAYLRKSVIYAHFDENHYDEGYFDYERDGFGEVEYDLDSTVDRIIEYMENGCKLKDKYRERIDRFFAYNDRNNCQRVYDKIMELESR